jgi:hypothetical protein
MDRLEKLAELYHKLSMGAEKEQWFPRALRTEEFRENLEPGFGAKVHGTFTSGGIPITNPELHGRNTLAIYQAIAELDERGHTTFARRAREEVGALLDEIDSLRKQLEAQSEE